MTTNNTERFFAPQEPASHLWRVYTRSGEIARGLTHAEAKALSEDAAAEEEGARRYPKPFNPLAFTGRSTI